MSQQKFATLEALVAHIKSAQKGAQRARAAKSLREPEELRQSKEQQLANALARKIEEELKWQPRRIVLLCLHQHCQCGQDMRSVVGTFVESVHKDSRARRLRQGIADPSRADRLPHSIETINEAIDLCPNCLLERQVAEALLHPTHDACVQLTLFDHNLQRRAA